MSTSGFFNSPQISLQALRHRPAAWLGAWIGEEHSLWRLVNAAQVADAREPRFAVLDDFRAVGAAEIERLDGAGGVPDARLI